jgi:hypothetical protein
LSSSPCGYLAFPLPPLHRGFFIKSINRYTTAIFNTNGTPIIISVFIGSK